MDAGIRTVATTKSRMLRAVGPRADAPDTNVGIIGGQECGAKLLQDSAEPEGTSNTAELA